MQFATEMHRRVRDTVGLPTKTISDQLRPFQWVLWRWVMDHLTWLSLCGALGVAGCATPEPEGLLSVQNPIAEPISVQQIFVTTTRAPTFNGFGSARSEDLAYARYAVSIPPAHRAGTIAWGDAQPDLQKHFGVVDRKKFTSPTAFEAAINARLRTISPAEQEAVLYVHGYNTTFAESLFRFAQIKHDLALPPISVHYAWPSTGRVRDYARDRDSALFARDGLEDTLLALINSDVKRIVVVGHSLGAFLVTETLRQMGRRTPVRYTNKLAGVILISPDIDAELFTQQISDAPSLPQPFLVFSSPRDNALNLSGWLTGKPRLGSLTGASELADQGITFIDVSKVPDAADAHLVPATSPAVLKLIKGMGQTIRTISNAPLRRLTALGGDAR